ncbi:MAG: ATP-binding cassette domain-containing protein [Candidatus Nanopelagicales bacterium]
MTTGAPVDIRGLTKVFGRGAGAVHAVEDLSFTVEPGRVTGFLGPNGAGKTTTLRCLLGLVTPTAGTATIGGHAYRDLEDPEKQVGSALEASGFHPGRTARDHLRILAAAADLPDARADAALDQVGLADSARRRVGGFSLGMRQRLALASALLGDPAVLVLDEPANGLDPEGIAWLRGFLRYLAGDGRTVLVSSHALAEVEQTVDDVVIVARGRLVATGSLAEITAGRDAGTLVRTPGADTLAAALEAGVDGARPDRMDRPGPDTLVVHGITAALVGRAALRAGVELHELTPQQDDLERVFLDLTAQGPADVASGPPGATASGAAPGTPNSTSTPGPTS